MLHRVIEAYGQCLCTIMVLVELIDEVIGIDDL